MRLCFHSDRRWTGIRDHRRRGMALIVVVAILAALFTMGATFALLMRLERRSAINLTASEEARVSANNLLDAAVQTLENRRTDYDGHHAATHWFDMQNLNPNLTIIDLDSRLNVKAMGRSGETLGSEPFLIQRLGSTDSWMSRTIFAALEGAGALSPAHRAPFALLLSDMIAEARYGKDGTPGKAADNIFYADLEHRLGFDWAAWNPAANDIGLMTYPVDSPIGHADGVPTAIRDPLGVAHTEPNIVFQASDAVQDLHYSPEDPLGDDQPFSTFWQVVALIDKALEEFDSNNGTDYFNSSRKEVSEALEDHLCVHSHTRSPDSTDINAAIPERARITGVSDSSLTLERPTPFAFGSLAGRVVMVIQGPGTGEWRTVVDNDGDTILIDVPWNPAPNRPAADSVCIIVEEWEPVHANPYDRLYRALGLRGWAEAGPNPALKREQAARLLANILDFKDADDIPTRIEIDANGIAYGPGWNAAGAGISVWGAEGLHFTEFMATPDRITPQSGYLVDDGNPGGGGGAPGEVVYTGRATNSSTSTVLVNNQPNDWTANQWQGGYTVGIILGLGAGQVRSIISNGVNWLEVPAWDTTPNNSSRFRIYRLDGGGGDDYWTWEGGYWEQKHDSDVWGVWEFTGLKDGWYALKVYGAQNQTLRVRYNADEFNVPINRGPENGLHYGYFRGVGDALVPVHVQGGLLRFEIQGGQGAIFRTIQLLPQFICISNIAQQSPARSTSHAIDVSDWTIRLGAGGGPHDFLIPSVGPYNAVPAVSPDGVYPINYGIYIVAISGNVYAQQWGAISNPEAVVFPVGDYGVNRATKDQNADWLVRNLAGGNIALELHHPNFGLVAGGDIDGAAGLDPIDYISHQKTWILGTDWEPYGNYASSDAVTGLTSSQNFGMDAWVVVESGYALDSSTPGLLRVDPAIYNWTNNQWAGYTIFIVAGTGAGQERVINQNQNASLTVVTNFSPAADSTSRFEIRRTVFKRLWFNERYTDLWTVPGVTLKTSEELGNDGWVLPIVLNRPYLSRGWLGLVPSGSPWRSVDPASDFASRTGPEDLLGLLMSNTRTSASYARLNVNTASEAALKGIFDDATAQWIVQRRQAGPWTSWEALLNEPELMDYFAPQFDFIGAGTFADDYPNNPDMYEEWFRRFGDLIDIRSSAFLIRASGTDTNGGSSAIVEAVVDRQRDTVGDGYPNCSIVEFRYVTETE